MAYDKVVNSKQLDEGLTLIADTIRTRGLTQNKLSFPYGMQIAIKDIPMIHTDIAKSIIEIKSNMTEVGKSLFNNCRSLERVDLPEAMNVQSYGFNGCSNLTYVNIPSAEYVDSSAFSYCFSLSEIDANGVYRIGSGAFNNCSKLSQFVGARLGEIGSNAFKSCFSLKALVIVPSNGICWLASTNAFEKCVHFTGEVHSTYNPQGLKDGYIYVYDSLIDDYRNATNWSSLADRIKPLSEYDPTKI